MPVTTTSRTRGVEVSVSGRLTPRLAERMLDAVRKAIVDVPRSVIVDMSEVTGLSAAGVGALFVLADVARDWPEAPVVLVAQAPLEARLAGVSVADRLVVRHSLLAAYAAVGTAPAVIVDRLNLSASSDAPKLARHFVLEHLPPGSSRHLRDGAALVVTELVSNAVLHGGEQVQLRLVQRGHVVRIAVSDSLPVADFPFTDRLLSDEHGRGLMVVRALSVRFGTLPTPSGGKVVWSVLDDEPPPIARGAD
jgi:anti-sigma regulatory factor (Ser/Thr protein kinase)